MNSLLHDLRHAVRALAQSPGFTVAALLTLALGIGANTAAFGVVDALLFRSPAGVGEAGSLYRVAARPPQQAMGGMFSGSAASYPQYEDLRDKSAGVSQLTAYSSTRIDYGVGADAQQLKAVLASNDYFAVLRVKPALGRLFVAGPDRGTAPVAVLGYDFWQREFGGDPHVLGKAMKLGDATATVVGVAPRGFRGVDLDPVDVWLPLSMAEQLGWSPDILDSRNNLWLQMAGRLKPGTTPEQAAAAATAVVQAQPQPEFMKTFAGKNSSSRASAWTVTVSPITDRYAPEGEESPVPVWLLGVTAAVLLIACANVASLFLARGARRRREIAIRLALGAGRWRIVRQFLVESVLLALVAAGLGVLFADWSAHLFKLLDVPAIDGLIDGRVLAVTLAAALVASIAFGLLPALRAARTDVEAELKASSLRASGDRSPLRRALTAGQLAASLVLLVSAGLFVRSLRNVRAIDTGYDYDRVLLVSVNLRGQAPGIAVRTKPGGDETDVRAREFREHALERLRRLPGVVAADVGQIVPFASIRRSTIDVPGHEVAPGDPPDAAFNSNVGADYFRTVGLRLRDGRVFGPEDREGTAPVVVVTDAFARKFWPGERAVGKCFYPGGRGDAEAAKPCATVVGVVADMKLMGLREDPAPLYFEPIAQHPDRMGHATIHVRTRGEPEALAASIRRELQAMDPTLPYIDVRPMADLLRPELQPWRVAAATFTVFGLLAFLLAAIGLYGVIAYMAAQRTREVGIRIALGARGADVAAMVLGEGLRLALIGGVVGILAALAVTRLFASKMYGVRVTDPVTYIGAAVLLGAVALLASYLPARRATRVDPTVALRAE